MNKQQEQLAELKEIRSLMERSSRFLSLSGLAGVVIGVFALLGVAAVYAYIDFAPLTPAYYQLADSSFYIFFFADALLVLSLSLLAGSFMARIKSKQLNLPLWDASTKRVLINMAIPLVAGGLYCLILFDHGHFEFMPSATLLFYGLALLNAGKYTIDDIRYLGIIELAIGLAAAYFIDYGLLIWAFGFGLMHLVYGIFIYLKYEK